MTRAGLTADGAWALEGVKPEWLPLVWPMAWPLLEPSIATLPEEYRPGAESIAADLAAGTKQLWIAWDMAGNRLEGVALTEITEWQGEQACHIWAAGGRGFRRYIRDAMAILRAWATQHGCATVLHGGRRGWQRIAGTTQIGTLDGRHAVYGCPSGA